MFVKCLKKKRYSYAEVVACRECHTNWQKFGAHPVSGSLLWVIANYVPVHPNVLTLCAFGLAVISAFFYLKGSYSGFLLGAFFFYFSFCLDTIDGALARLLHKTSSLGAWLDSLADILRSAIAASAFSIGCYRMTGDVRTLFLGFGIVIVACFYSFIAVVSTQYAGARPGLLVARSSWFVMLKKLGIVPSPYGLADFEATYLILFPIFQEPVLGMIVAFVLGGLTRIVAILLTVRNLYRKDLLGKTPKDSL